MSISPMKNNNAGIENQGKSRDASIGACAPLSLEDKSEILMQDDTIPISNDLDLSQT